ncbi:MAG: tRNA (N6-isopentenyl adenosine(37)-C2)-methylthiotransferase MiaB [Syntrophales bacterium]|nr:tRNA (N6-isopentenyl adenosine(37)-C2)-methylthiotransferase MiaB [Syntrophales bacterium]
MDRKYLYIQTFGCQMNVNDSDKIVTLLRDEGYETTDDAECADLVLVNTCSIREKAAQKAYSQLGRFRMLKERNPELILAMGGCLAQQWGQKILARAPYLNVVFGTHNIHRLPEFIRMVEKNGSRVVETEFQTSVKSLGITAVPQNGAVSAYVTIMQGCNNFCAYCVVPHLRGREESRPADDVIPEVEKLADHGIREVTLLGQNVNAYGKTIAGSPGFAQLLRAIGRVKGIERIRFTTSHPKDLTEDLMRCFAEVEALCDHIHLPVQSGSDAILRRMNRGYTRDQYLEKIEGLRHFRPEISITSDVIVGFPGETEKDYQATLALMEAVKFDNLFSFKYSEREGTAAVGFEHQVPEKVKRERLQQLQALQEEHTLKRNRMLEGRVQDVLVEGKSRNSEHDITGRTRSNKIVNFRGGRELAGKTCSVLIKKACLHSLRGEMVEGTENPCSSK